MVLLDMRTMILGQFLSSAVCAAGRPFAAVIMDLTISGGMGGAEAVKKLKELDPSAKAIVSSGYADAPIMADYGAHGFLGMLSKPYQLEDLAAIMGKVLG
ncbi:MAG: response regulator [Elusimicrobia bacterium]|nr:response regulator [Elusimicrobiota bacterium]